MSFLPNDYESPKSNSIFMKFEDGDNKIRILCSPIIGWEDWKDKKPVRFRRSNKPENPIDPKKPIRHFWAFIIWNYKPQKIQVLELTQSSIRKRIETLSKDADWGSPFHYDIKITKKGQQVETDYTVNPIPHSPLDQNIKEAFLETPIDLEEMFRGEDVVVGHGEYRTRGFWEEEDVKQSSQLPSTDALITEIQAKDLETLVFEKIIPKDPRWADSVFKVLGIKSFKEMKKVFYDTMVERIDQKIKMILLEEEIPF